MRLSIATIQNYKSVDDSGPVRIDSVISESASRVKSRHRVSLLARWAQPVVGALPIELTFRLRRSHLFAVTAA